MTLQQRYRCTLTTIEEELFREDPLVFTMFVYPIRMSAMELLWLCFVMDLIYLFLSLIHLFPIKDSMNPICLMISMILTLIMFFVSAFVQRNISQNEFRLRETVRGPILWIFVRMFTLIYDITITTYTVSNLDFGKDTWAAFERVIVYTELFQAIWCLMLSVWIVMAVRRLVHRNPLSCATSQNTGRRNDSIDVSHDLSYGNSHEWNYRSPVQTYKQKSPGDCSYVLICDDNGGKVSWSSSSKKDKKSVEKKRSTELNFKSDDDEFGVY